MFILYIGLLHLTFYLLLIRNIKASNYLVNIINHTLLSISALITFDSNDIKNTSDKINDHIELSEHLAFWLKQYLIYDILMMMYTKSDRLDFYVHHCVSILFMTQVIENTFLQYYVPIFIMFEISSIPLNVRYFLLELNVPRENKWLKLSELLFSITFIFFRYFVGVYYILDAVYELEKQREIYSFGNFFVPYYVLTFFIVLHVYWLKKLVIKMKKEYMTNDNFISRYAQSVSH